MTGKVFENGDKKSLGKAGEDFACAFLESKGHEILCRNYTRKGGEIDIISAIGKYIVFTEVKIRSGNYSPMKSVTPKKIATVMRCAKAFLEEKSIVPSRDGLSMRIDIVALKLEKDGTIALHSHIERLNLLPVTSGVR